MVGDYLTAYNDVLMNGGQLYPGNGKDSANVVVRGKTCYTYWKSDSKRHQEVIELCKYFNIPSTGQTGGRICRWLIQEVLKVPYEGTYWQRNWRLLAKSGQHWHYLTVQPKKYFWGVEFDIKSAYFSSLFAGKSLLWDNKLRWIDDDGALENLKALTPFLPKWFRLQVLGTLASWRIFFLCRNSGSSSSNDLIYKSRHLIKYGSAFNCSHRAILRNYKIMKKVHEMGKEFVMRMHTDSFTLSVDCPGYIEKQIFDYLESKSLKYDIKSAGYGYFFDVNCGYVGKKFIGAKINVLDLMREHDIKMKRNGGINEVLDRFGERIESSSFDIKNSINSHNKSELEYEQMELFTLPYS